MQRHNVLTRSRSSAKYTRSSGAFDLKGLNVEARTVPLSFSSETAEVKRQLDEGSAPVPEILLHDPESADLDFLRSSGSVLMNHDPDQIVGSVESVLIDPKTRRGKALIRFSRTEDGEKAFELVRDGSLRGVSFGYDWIDGYVDELPAGETFRSETSGTEFNGPAIVVKRWRALEITLTPVPADVSVGVGRSKNTETVKGKTVSLKQMVTRECLRKGLGLRAAKKIIDLAGTDETHAREMIADMVKAKKRGGENKVPKDSQSFRKEKTMSEMSDETECRKDEEGEVYEDEDDESEAETEDIDAAEKIEDLEEGDVKPPKRSRPAAKRRSLQRDPVRAERLRCTDITARCREAGLNEEFADDLIERGVSIGNACKAIMDEQKERGSAKSGLSGGGRGSDVSVRMDATDKKLRWMEAGIIKRLDPVVRNSRLDDDMSAKVKIVTKDGETTERSVSSDPWVEHADQFREFTDSPRTLTEYAREYLSMLNVRGVRSMDKHELSRQVFSMDTKIRAAAGNVTASLPNIMANVLGKQMLRLWKRTDPTWRYWCKIGTLEDYKVNERILMSDTGDLVAMNENGDIPDSQIGDSQETIQLKDYGRGISLTHQMFVNDDLNALATLTARMTQAALRLPTKLTYTKLLANPTLNATGNQLFFPTQNNLFTGGSSALSNAALKTAIAGFRKQIAFIAPNEPQGNAEPLDILPRILLVPPELEKTAFDLVNPNLFVQDALFFKGKYIVVVEPRLSTYSSNVPTVVGQAITGSTPAVITTGWFLMGDPGNADTFEVGFLNGSDKPMMRQVERLDRLALDMQIVLPCAVAPLDYRGAQWNLGA